MSFISHAFTFVLFAHRSRFEKINQQKCNGITSCYDTSMQ